MIDWKEGAVCYAGSTQRKFDSGSVYWLRSDGKWISGSHIKDVDVMIDCSNFQLNEPREGYYIPKSELDTEEKYNQAVEVFGLFGYGFLNAMDFNRFSCFGYEHVVIEDGFLRFGSSGLVKLTFDQLMIIGELKRKMNEREELQKSKISDLPIFKGHENKQAKKIKAKEAYRILESMGIEWDNVEGKWFKVSKEWL